MGTKALHNGNLQHQSLSNGTHGVQLNANGGVHIIQNGGPAEVHNGLNGAPNNHISEGKQYFNDLLKVWKQTVAPHFLGFDQNLKVEDWS